MSCCNNCPFNKMRQMDTPDDMIRLAGPIERDSLVNGPGLRAVIWTQGCRQRCPGCQNPETWDETAGQLVSIDKVKAEISLIQQNNGITGITFCGGEPLIQAKACLEIAKHAKSLGLSVWSFTGFIYEQIPKDSVMFDLIRELDALIDGPFILAKKDLTLDWRGSSNQRVLHLKNGEIQQIS